MAPWQSTAGARPQPSLLRLLQLCPSLCFSTEGTGRVEGKLGKWDDLIVTARSAPGIDQDLRGLFKDERLDRPGRNQCSPQTEAPALGSGTGHPHPGVTCSQQGLGFPHLNFLGQNSFGEVIVHTAICLGTNGRAEGHHSL